jgi:SLT domain-containing protein
MATSLDALLRIKAQVSGTEAVNGMRTALTGASNAASRAGGAFKGLAGAGGGLGGALGALAPALSIAGLGAMAKNSIAAADGLYDMSQKTGISVEVLSKFGKAAKLSGTDLDTVAGAIGKLGKNMYEAANGNDKMAKEFDKLGIKIKDAKGNLRSADDVLLDLANNFKNKKDGPEKMAQAMTLLGRSGRELIPLLNMGGDAISSMSTKMTTEFAKAADQYSDKMVTLSGKIGGLGAKIAIALLPSLTTLTDKLLGLVDGFNALDPQLQKGIGIVVVLGGLLLPIAATIGLVASGIGTVVGFLAGFAGIGATIAGWLGAVVPLIAGIGSALSGLGTVLVGIFTGPVGWIALLIAVGVALYAFRDQVGQVFQAIGAIAEVSVNGLKGIWQGFTGWLSGAFQAIGNFFNQYITQPLVNAWNGAIDLIKRALRGLLSFAAGIINSMISAVNRVLQDINNKLAFAERISARFGTRLGRVGLMQQVAVPAFANGGYVTGPTLGMVGEGGQPEYIIPANRMASASSAYLSGARGSSVLAAGGSGANGAPVVNITTGPIMQAGGQSWVTLTDLERATKQTAEQVFAVLRTPAGRRAVGMA